MSKRKPVSELAHDELARRVFPRKVVQEAKKIARERGRGTTRSNHLNERP